MPKTSGGAEQVISLPKGGGALKGLGETFQPDLHTGTGNFSVPIALPPGRNGLQPQLALTYSTGQGNGPFGLGWSLSVPGVTLKTSKGVPRYQGDDTYILSGAEDLVLVEEEAVSRLGMAWGWGSGSATPGLVSALTEVVAIAAGGHSLALASDGTVWAWGVNGNGQLGDGTTHDRLTPVPVQNLSGVVAIAAGMNHSLALKEDGTVWAWGYNAHGQLGIGTTDAPLIPVQVHGLSGVVAIAAGSLHSLALMADGTVWAWGYNGDGELGDGTRTTQRMPVLVRSLRGVVAIAAGGGHSLALQADGTVWAWGYNAYGGCGDGLDDTARPTIRVTPVPVTHLSGVVAIAAGGGHCLALRADGTVWAWGLNTGTPLPAPGGGQLGDGTLTHRSTPVQVVGLCEVVGIAAGGGHSLARTADDAVWAWGVNVYGQLGDGTTTARLTPVPVGGLTEVVALAAGYWHSLALTRQETGGTGPQHGYRRRYRPRTEGLFARIVHHHDPSNDYWEVRSKDGLVSYYGTPEAAGTDPAVVADPSNRRKLFAWKLTRTVDAFGNRIQYEYIRDPGQDAGHPWDQVYLKRIRYVDHTAYSTASYLVSVTFAYTDRPDPFSDYRAGFAIRTTKRCTRIEVRTHTDQECVVRAYDLVYLDEQNDPDQPLPLNGVSLLSQITVTSDGGHHGWAWGSGLTAHQSTPGLVRELTEVMAIAAGNGYSLALAPDRTVWAWGVNSAGELGDGTRDDRHMPVPVRGLSGVVSVAAGWDHSLALKADGTVWTWGENAYGQLGLGTTDVQLTPVQVPGLSEVVAIAAGKLYSLALKTDGTVWAWGGNGGGALGDGTGITRLSPVQAPGLSEVVAIAAGGGHSLALKADGTVWACGYNAYGSCGDGLEDTARPPCG